MDDAGREAVDTLPLGARDDSGALVADGVGAVTGVVAVAATGGVEVLPLLLRFFLLSLRGDGPTCTDGQTNRRTNGRTEMHKATLSDNIPYLVLIKDPHYPCLETNILN